MWPLTFFVVVKVFTIGKASLFLICLNINLELLIACNQARYMKRGMCLYARAHTHTLYMRVSYQIKFPKSSSTSLICVKVPVVRFKHCADLRLLEVSNFIGTLDWECIMKIKYYEDMKTNIILIWIVDEKYFWPILYILNIADIQIIKSV